MKKKLNKFNFTYLNGARSGSLNYKKRVLIFGPGIYSNDLSRIRDGKYSEVKHKRFRLALLANKFSDNSIVFPEMVAMGFDGSLLHKKNSFYREYINSNVRDLERILALDSDSVINFLDTNSAVMELGLYSDKKIRDKHFLLIPEVKNKKLFLNPITEFIKLTVPNKNIMYYRAITEGNSYKINLNKSDQKTWAPKFKRDFRKNSELKQFFRYYSNDDVLPLLELINKKTGVKTKRITFYKYLLNGGYSNKLVRFSYKQFFFLIKLFFSNKKIINSNNQEGYTALFKNFITFLTEKLNYKNENMFANRIEVVEPGINPFMVFMICIGELYFFDQIKISEIGPKLEISGFNFSANINIKSKGKKSRLVYPYDFPLGEIFKQEDEKILFWFNNEKSLYEDNISDDVYSFVRKRNIAMAIKPHLKSKHFFKTDISKFFDSLDHEMLNNKIEKLNLNSSQREIIKGTYLRGRGVMQGRILSPSLSNLFMHDFDKKIKGKFVDIKYSRYADDILISSTSQIAESVKEWIVKELKDLKLDINKNKTGDVNLLNEHIKYLGVSIRFTGKTRIVTFSNRKWNHIIKLVLSYISKESDRKWSKISGYKNIINMFEKEGINFRDREIKIRNDVYKFSEITQKILEDIS